MPKKVYDDARLKAEALKLRRQGYSYREVARKLGCSVYKVYELISDHESPRSRLKQTAELATKLEDLSSKVEVLSSRIAGLESSISNLKTLEDLANELSMVRKEVENLKNSLSRRLNEIANSMDFIRQSAERRLRDDYNGCKWLSKDGYCTCWAWYNKVKGWNMKTDIVEGRVVYRLNVKKHPLICTACPSYQPRGY